MTRCAVVRVIEQCCFNSVPDPFNGQTVNFILKPPNVFESRTYVKKFNLEHYWNNTVLLLWRQHSWSCLFEFQVERSNFQLKYIFVGSLDNVCKIYKDKLKVHFWSGSGQICTQIWTAKLQNLKFKSRMDSIKYLYAN